MIYSQTFTNIVNDGQTDAWKNLLDKANLRQINTKEIVFHEHSSSDYLFYLVKGNLEIFVTNEDGKSLVLNDLTEGCVFGELGLILDKPRSASVRATQPSRLKIIRKQDFFTELENNHQLNFYLLSSFAKRITDLSDNLSSMALEDVYYRVKLLLQNLSSSDLESGTVLDKITHDNVALHVGSSREMVTKIFKELTFGGYIEVTNDKIHIIKSLPKHF